MLCNNANARRCSYFELGLPVVSLINSYLAIFVFSVFSEEVRVYNKSEQFDEKTNKQTKQRNKQTDQTKKQTNIKNSKPSFTHQNYNSAVYMFIIC